MALPSIFSGKDPDPPTAAAFSTGTPSAREQFQTAQREAFGRLQGRFQEEGPLGLFSGEEVRLRPREKSVLTGLAEETGYVPKRVAPMQPGRDAAAGAEFVTEETADRASREGTILMDPIRTELGEAARYNAAGRNRGSTIAEEIAHDITLSDREEARDSARAVAGRHGADPDSLASLFNVSFEESYSQRPQERVAKSLTPAVEAVAGQGDSASVDPMHMDLARSLFDATAKERDADRRFFQRFVMDEIETGAAPPEDFR